MIANPNRMLPHAAEPCIVALNIGNTTSRLSVYAPGVGASGATSEPAGGGVYPSGDPDAVAAMVIQAAREAEGESEGGPVVVAMASVKPEAAARVYRALKAELKCTIARIPEDVPIPLALAIDPDTRPGSDRLLACLAAFEVIQQACVVVDAGTAITVNFVDGEGTFQGGAIAPGVAASLGALHASTAALPSLTPERPPVDEWIAKSTEAAMRQGAHYGARGLVRLLVERYAEAYEAFPQVIACGGDAESLFAADEFVDRIVPDLVLRGIAVCVRKALEDDEQADDLSTGQSDRATT